MGPINPYSVWFGRFILVFLIFCLHTFVQSINDPSVVSIAAILNGHDADGDVIDCSSAFDPVYPLQQLFINSWLLWQDEINRSGGIKTRTGLNAYSYKNVSIDCFNVGRLTNYTIPGHAYSVLIERSISLANRLIPTDPNTAPSYGHYTFIIPNAYVPSGLSFIFQNQCETTQDCITIVPFDTSQSTFICEPTFGSNDLTSLPPDCAYRSLRSGDRRWQYSVSAVASSGPAFDSHTALFSSLGAQSAAVFTFGNTEFDLLVFNSLQQELFIQGFVTVFSNTDSLKAPLLDNLGQMTAAFKNNIDSLVKSNPDVIFITAKSNTTDIDSLMAFLQYIKKVGFYPSAIAIAGGGHRDISNSMPLDSRYIFGTNNWNSLFRGSNYRAFSSPSTTEVFAATSTSDSPSVFTSKYTSRYGSFGEYGNIAAFATSTVLIIQKAIEISGIYSVNRGDSTSTNNLLNAIQKISSPSLFGTLQLDVNGVQLPLEGGVVQLQNGVEVWVYPLYVAQAIVYPAPNWNERVYTFESYSDGLEVILGYVNGGGLFYCLILLFGVIYYRKNPVIKASMTDFCCLVITGGMMMITSNFFSVLNVTDSFCIVSSWLLTCGFTLLFSSLFTKLFVVYRIFSVDGQRLSMFAFTRTSLYSMVAVCLLSDVILNSIWTWIGNLQSERVYLDQYRPVYDYTQCMTTDLSKNVIITSIIVKGIFVLGGCVLSFKSRNLPSQFNETFVIGVSVYNALLVSIFVVSLVASNSAGRRYTYLIRTLGIFLFVILTLSILFIHKFILIFTKNDKSVVTRSSGSLVNGANPANPKRLAPRNSSKLILKPKNNNDHIQQDKNLRPALESDVLTSPDLQPGTGTGTPVPLFKRTPSAHQMEAVGSGGLTLFSSPPVPIGTGTRLNNHRVQNSNGMVITHIQGSPVELPSIIKRDSIVSFNLSRIQVYYQHMIDWRYSYTQQHKAIQAIINNRLKKDSMINNQHSHPSPSNNNNNNQQGNKNLYEKMKGEYDLADKVSLHPNVELLVTLLHVSSQLYSVYTHGLKLEDHNSTIMDLESMKKEWMSIIQNSYISLTRLFLDKNLSLYRSITGSPQMSPSIIISSSLFQNISFFPFSFKQPHLFVNQNQNVSDKDNNNNNNNNNIDPMVQTLSINSSAQMLGVSNNQRGVRKNSGFGFGSQ